MVSIQERVIVVCVRKIDIYRYKTIEGNGNTDVIPTTYRVSEGKVVFLIGL